MTLDLLGTPDRLRTDPYVVAASRLVADLLIPQAELVDVEGVPAGHVRAVAAAGLLGVTAPPEVGGGGAAPAVGREVTELLAGADGSTWFVVTQHASPLKALLGSDNAAVRRRWLGPMASGAALSGVAFSHLRRPGAPAVTATPRAGGWVVDGHVGWLTGWGLAEVFLLGARAGADVVLAMVPARAGPAVRPSGELRLAAMQAAHTVTLDLDGLVVPAADVVAVLPYEEWAAADARATANVTPAVFGLLRRVVRRLAETAERRGEPAGLELAAGLAADGASLRSAAYRLIDEVPADDGLAERLRVRAAALELVTRAAAGLVAAGAGASMAAAHPAQRLAREALFHLVQAQTEPVRTATLRRLAEVGAER